MAAFLKQIADKLLASGSKELGNTLVIVPNRRAKVYILKYISESINSPIFTPEIISINDFIYNQLNMLEAEPMDILIQLYKVHQGIERNNSQSLDQFSSWADLLISDFNDIDLYMVPVDRLFSYLSDAKEIEKWDLDPEKLTEQEKNYLKFYKKLRLYYSELNKILIENNTAYQGMAFRLMAEKNSFDKMNYNKIYIAGFNAFTLAEEIIITKLKTDYSAEMIWDIDNYYFQNKSHEAGHFLRKHLKNEDLEKISFIENNWLEQEKNINIYGIDGNIAQVKYAAEILQKQLEENPDSQQNTALILANEDLLIPVINSIPEGIKKFNLTMSYPLRLHSGYDLIKTILNLYNDYKFEEGYDGGLNIYHKTFISFLMHPYIQNYFENSDTDLKSIIKNINQQNIQRIDNNYLDEFSSTSDKALELVALIKSIKTDVKTTVALVINIIELLDSTEDQIWEKAFFKHYIKVLNELNESLSEVAVIEKLNTIKRWIQNTVNHSPIPFIGEPLQGLQIMGMLETRTLDFKNIIILSVNEDVLPKTQVYQSFILFDIKKEFGMPLPSDNDAITAYHFYRLLQKTKNVNLLYNSSTGGMQSSEMSRYIKQIELEIPEQKSKVNISHTQVKFGFNSTENPEEIIIHKTDEIIAKLRTWASEKGFSPSSLNNYKRCSYLFYLQKVLGIKSTDEVEENMAYNTQGNIIHNSLEDYYLQYLGKELTYEEFDKTSERIFDIFNEKLATEYVNMNTKTGKNYLTTKILEQYLINFIKSEKAFLKKEKSIIILGAEEDLKKNFDIDIYGTKSNVKIKGSADRIDLLGRKVRLIDYKTGKVESSDVKITISKKGTGDKWPLMFEGDKEKAFQLMMYAWMYWDKKSPMHSLETSISGLKYHSSNFPLNIYGETEVNNEDISRFETDLKGLISNIFDKDIPFLQRENDSKCAFCDYKSICSR